MNNTENRNMNGVTRLSRMFFCSASLLALGLAMPAMAQNAQTMETVTVTGQRAAIESAIKLKENADQIVDSIVADDAGKLPDRSITEVLQRVSGVTTTHFNNLGNPDDYTVEGSGPTVRGLPGGSSQLNGHNAFSANGGRQILWGDVPSELMAAVDVYKTYTPDQLEGGLGGSINLRTHKPFDFEGTKISGVVSASYGDLIKQARPKFSLMGSTRWDTKLGEMGLLIDLSYDDSSYRNDSIQVDPYYPHANVVDNYTITGAGPSVGVALKPNPTVYWLPGGFGYHTADGYHKRGGAYAAFQWRPNDRLSLYLTAFSTLNDGNELLNDFRGGGAANFSNVTYTPTATGPLSAVGTLQLITALSSGTPAPNSPFYHLYDASNNLVYANSYYDTNFGGGWTPGLDAMKDQCTQGSKLCSTGITYTTASKSFARTTDLNGGANWEPTDNWKVRSSFDFIYSKSSGRSFDVQLNAIMQPYGMDLRGSYPTIVMGDPAALRTASSYYWNSTMDSVSRNYGQEMQGNVDGEYSLHGGFFKKIKVGVRGDIRLEHDQGSGFKWNGLTPTWVSPQHYLTDAQSKKDTALYQFPNFFRGEANLPGPALFVAPGAVQAYDSVRIHQLYGVPGDTTTNAVFDPNLAARYKTVNVAGYAMAEFSSESVFGMPLSGNAGARLVYVDNQSVASWTQNANILFKKDFGAGNQVYVTAPYTNPKAEGRVSWTLLPAFNVQVMPTDKVHIRLAGSITAEQPGFPGSYSSYGVSVDSNNNATGFSLNANNLRLKPQLGRNLDLSAEWYGDGGASAYVSLFYKSLKHRQITSFEMQNVLWVVGNPATAIAPGNTTPILPTAATVACTNDAKGNCTLVNNQTFVVTAPTTVQSIMNSNKEDVIRGAEFGFNKYFDFDFLPSYAKGFGVSGNFTYIDSRARGDYSFDMYGNNIGSHLPLAGMSHYSYNAILMYDRDPVSFRLAYNWRSKYLMSAYGWNTQGNYQASDDGISCPINNTPAGGFGGNSIAGTCHFSLPVWSKSFGSLDAGMNYNIDDHFSFNIQSQNLLNTKAKTTMGYGLREYSRSWFVADRRVSIDLRANF